MEKLPKRRKKKDNPYTLLIENSNYYVLFKDGRFILHKIKISKEIFEAFNSFELDDKKIMNEFDRHIEHYELTEESIYKNSSQNELNVEKQVIKKSEYETLKKAINELPIIQRERVKKYFFENKTYDEIAKEECVNKSSIKRAIDNGLENISKKLQD